MARHMADKQMMHHWACTPRAQTASAHNQSITSSNFKALTSVVLEVKITPLTMMRPMVTGMRSTLHPGSTATLHLSRTAVTY